MWLFPGGATDNRNYYGDKVTFKIALSEQQQMMLFDPQTSGGLLLGIGSDRLDEFLEKAKKSGQSAWVIGEAVEKPGIEIA